MVFQGEDVPLTEDIIKKSARQFFPTFSEWASDGNIEQIWKSVRVTGTTTLFVVPKNFTLFITSAFITAISTSGGSSHGNPMLRVDSSDSKIIIACSVDHHNLSAPTSGNNSITFPMPLRILEGSVIQISNQLASPLSAAGFVGFLMPKKISIR